MNKPLTIAERRAARIASRATGAGNALAISHWEAILRSEGLHPLTGSTMARSDRSDSVNGLTPWATTTDGLTDARPRTVTRLPGRKSSPRAHGLTRGHLATSVSHGTTHHDSTISPSWGLVVDREALRAPRNGREAVLVDAQGRRFATLADDTQRRVTTAARNAKHNGERKARLAMQRTEIERRGILWQSLPTSGQIEWCLDHDLPAAARWSEVKAVISADVRSRVGVAG